MCLSCTALSYMLFLYDTMGCNLLQAVSDKELGLMLQWTGTTGVHEGVLLDRCVASSTLCCRL